MTPPTPGIHADIPMQDYHDGPGVSRSDLMLVDRSPAHFYAARLDPDREPEKRVANLGSVVHKIVLEPMSFGDEFVVAPEGLDRRTKAGKAEWAELNAGGQIVISKAMHDQALMMALAVNSHPTAARLLDSEAVQFERSIYWTDYGVTGELCKCRPDAFCDDWIADLKWVDDARPAAFMRNLGKHRWDRQAAWYGDGVCAARRVRPPFVFIAVEDQPPHGVRCFTLDQDGLGRAREENLSALERLHICKERDHWPGYDAEIMEVSLPRWAASKGED